MAADSTVDLIAEQEWLKPVEDAVGAVVRNAYSKSGDTGRQVKNFLHGAWLGHPLHPVLTDIPIGAWTAAVALDALDAASEDDFAPGADAAIALGLAGAVGSAVTGLTDWK